MSETSAAWEDVKRALDELGSSVAQWAASVKDDPENRRHIEELKTGINDLGDELGRIVDKAAQSDVGRTVGGAAQKAGDAIGDTARKVGTEAGPHVAAAFRSVAEGMRKAAESVESKVASADGPSPAPAPPVPPIPEGNPAETPDDE